jgi:hypothetical protein
MVPLIGAGCAHRSADSDVEAAQHVDFAAPAAATVLAGARCQDGQCRCRRPGDSAETVPPAPDYKRFEIRMSVAAGDIVLTSPTLGRLQHDGKEEACYYVDLPAGSNHEFVIESREAQKGQGMIPTVHIAEYGPKGHYWYDVLAIGCGFGDHHCDRAAATEWEQEWLTQRKRGRLDACGSVVVSALKWDTSGGQHMMDGGLLRDFRVQFVLQVKAFATQLPPRDPRCMPQ